MNVLMAGKGNPVANLGAWTFTVVTAGLYKMDIESFMVPISGLVAVIDQNGTPLATSIAVQPNQNNLFLETKIFANPGDLLTVTLSSSSVNDNIPNDLKSLINVGRL